MYATSFLHVCTFVLIAIQREEEKVKRSLKDAAKKGDKDVCRILAKEMIRSKKAVSKIHAAKAQLKSVEYNMNQQLGQSLGSVRMHQLALSAV